MKTQFGLRLIIDGKDFFIGNERITADKMNALSFDTEQEAMDFFTEENLGEMANYFIVKTVIL